MKELIAEYGMTIAFTAIGVAVISGLSAMLDYISAFPF